MGVLDFWKPLVIMGAFVLVIIVAGLIAVAGGGPVAERRSFPVYSAVCQPFPPNPDFPMGGMACSVVPVDVRVVE